MLSSISEVSAIKNVTGNGVASDAQVFDKQSAKYEIDKDKHEFSKLMDVVPPEDVSKPSTAPHSTSLSLLEHMAISHNTELRNLLEMARDSVHAAPGMSMAEMSAFGNEFGLRMMVSTTQFQIASSVGKSAGKGAETLMRNQ